MGERLHDIVLTDTKGRCRIYAPVGAHRDLLAYLVRRLLENGANSSFVHQIVDESVTPEAVARDPLRRWPRPAPRASLVAPAAIFGAGRTNSRASTSATRARWADRGRPRCAVSDAEPLTVSARRARGGGEPANGEIVAHVTRGRRRHRRPRHRDARASGTPLPSAPPSCAAPPTSRRKITARSLHRAGARGRGRSCPTPWANCARPWISCAITPPRARPDRCRRGIITAISPWNFPLAIFTGQIAAALMAGNAVLAKPAEQTPLIAAIAVRLLHQAGVPGGAATAARAGRHGRRGADVGRAHHRAWSLPARPRTAQIIARAMADHMAPRHAADRRNRRAERDDRRFDRAARTGGARYRRLQLPFGRPALFGLRCLYVREDIAP